MADKLTPNQIAAELRRKLCGTNNPTVEELAQNRPIHVSGDKVAKMCGCRKYDEVPMELCNAVCEEGFEIGIVVGFGYRTVIVGGDFPAAS